MLTVAAVVDHLERLAPTRLAADWDNVGLLLGDRAAPVSRIMTCLTVTPSSAAEAVDRQASLIVTHHPILFRAAKRLTADNSEGRMLLALARAGVAVYSPHTALDNAAGGINDLLAGKLGLVEVGPLRRGGPTTQARSASEGTRQCKLVVFVPENDLARVQDAVFAAGAGRIGEYRECSFRLAGTGTFFAGDAANPTVGQKGRREEVGEWRLEVVCPEARLGDVVAAMRKAHSYEEPAFDLYSLTAAPSGLGEGRVGQLPAASTLAELAVKLRAELRCGPVGVVGEPGRQVRRVAIVCGAGGDLLGDAVRARADVFLTGEARFHDYLAAQAQGLALLLPGHHATERCGVEDLAGRLRGQWDGVEVWASERESDPVWWA
jgi:dinuclear metal center YbgI/SA1388 family protein